MLYKQKHHEIMHTMEPVSGSDVNHVVRPHSMSHACPGSCLLVTGSLAKGVSGEVVKKKDEGACGGGRRGTTQPVHYCGGPSMPQFIPTIHHTFCPPSTTLHHGWGSVGGGERVCRGAEGGKQRGVGKDSNTGVRLFNVFDGRWEVKKTPFSLIRP